MTGDQRQRRDHPHQETPEPSRDSDPSATTIQTRALSRRIILIAGLGLMLPSLPAFLIGATAAQVREELGISEALLGVMVAALFATSAASAPFTGRLADRAGSRFNISLGTSLSALAMAGISLVAQNWLVLALCMATAGVGLALVDPGINRLVAGSVPERRRGLVFGIKEASIPLATMVAGFAVPTIAVTAGWRWVFIVGLLPLLLVILLLYTGNTLPVRVSGERDQPDAHEHTPSLTVSPATLYMAGGAALACMAATGISVFLTDSAVAAGLTQSQGGLLLGVASVAGMAVRIVSGMYADRRPGTGIKLIPWMLAAGSLTMMIGSIGSAVLLGVGTVGAVAAGWGWTALFFLALVRANPLRPGAVAGIGLAGLTAGNAVGPIAFSTVAQSVSYPAAWILAAVATGLAAASMHRGSRLL